MFVSPTFDWNAANTDHVAKYGIKTVAVEEVLTDRGSRDAPKRAVHCSSWQAKPREKRPFRKEAMILMKPVNEVPPSMTDEQSAAYWESHEITEDFLKEARPLEPSEMPPTRTESKTITVGFDVDILDRLQTLARQKHKGYQTLLKQFVIERLYEEEKKQHPH